MCHFDHQYPTFTIFSPFIATHAVSHQFITSLPTFLTGPLQAQYEIDRIILSETSLSPLLSLHIYRNAEQLQLIALHRPHNLTHQVINPSLDHNASLRGRVLQRESACTSSRQRRGRRQRWGKQLR